MLHIRIADIGTRGQSGSIVDNDSLISAILWWSSPHHQCPLRLNNYIALERISASAAVFLDFPEKLLSRTDKEFSIMSRTHHNLHKIGREKINIRFSSSQTSSLRYPFVLIRSLSKLSGRRGRKLLCGSSSAMLARTDDWAQLGFPAPAQSSTPNALSSNSKHSHILKIVANKFISSNKSCRVSIQFHTSGPDLLVFKFDFYLFLCCEWRQCSSAAPFSWPPASRPPPPPPTAVHILVIRDKLTKTKARDPMLTYKFEKL